MGREKDLQDANRWLLQAKDDLSAASLLITGKKYAQACFLCHQAGEKAIKSLWYLCGEDPWGHSISRLMDTFPDKAIKEKLVHIIEYGKSLDRLYIPTRYPNGLPDIIPGDAYGKVEAEEAVKAAEKIIQVCEEEIVSF
jgi:HEPN domain-containing protein